MSANGPRSRDHVVALPGDWDLWKLSVLRGAGFPAATVLDLARPDVAAAARAIFEAETAESTARRAAIDAIRHEETAGSAARAELSRAKKLVRKGRPPEDTGTNADGALATLRTAIEATRQAGETFEQRFAAARSSIARTLHEAARDPRFREAVSWQNRGALERYEQHVAATTDPAESNNKEDRRYEELIVSYLHRYCTKNDTIGFFGPVGWARWSATEEEVHTRAGESLVAARSVHFEQWPLDAFGESLFADPRLARWAPVRRYGFVRVEEDTAHSPVSGKHALAALEREVLRVADGTKPAHVLARELSAANPAVAPDETAVFAAIESLREKKLVAWSFELRTAWNPQDAIRPSLERIEDAALRADALAKLDELEEGRRAIAAAAGDVERLRDAQRRLDETFTKTTGAAHTRFAGATYAGRTVVFEDCRRDFDLVLSKRIVDDVGPALSLVLESARWLTHEVARDCTAAFKDIYDDLVRKRGSTRVPFADLWLRAQRFIFGTKDRPLDAAAARLRERWTAIFTPLGDPRRNELASTTLAPRVREAFAAAGPGWEMARHHSPDIMIGAKSIDALCAGDYLAVLGEVHVGLNTIDNAMFASQHPAPREIESGVLADAREPRVILVPPKHSPVSSVVRETRLTVGPHDFEIETGYEGSLLSPERVLTIGGLFVEEIDGRLVVTRGEHGGVTLPLLAPFGQTLSESVANSLDMFAETEHSPRVTIDKLVVHRESWRVMPSELPFAEGDASSEAEGFRDTLRFAEQRGMPRFVFVRSDLEVKPIFVDFESPLAVRVFRKLVRRAREHAGEPKPLKFSEMLPDLEHAWLFDGQARRYTSELRLAVVDRR
jgi:hypothetical protein